MVTPAVPGSTSMTDQRRSNDQDAKRRFFRSGDRVFRQSDGWYYSLREGDRGPYANEELARKELARFLQEQRDLAKFRSGQGAGGRAADDSIGMGSDKTVDKSAQSKDVWKGLPDVD